MREIPSKVQSTWLSLPLTSLSPIYHFSNFNWFVWFR